MFLGKTDNYNNNAGRNCVNDIECMSVLVEELELAGLLKPLLADSHGSRIKATTLLQSKTVWQCYMFVSVHCSVMLTT